MPDVALHRADFERQGRITALAINGSERFDLDRVAERGAGAMRLDVAHLGRLQLRRSQCLAQQRLLGDSVRHGQAAGTAVLVDRGAADHREHLATGGDRVREPLQHDQPTTLTAHEAVRRSVESLAASVRRQHAPLRDQHIRLGRQDRVDAAGQRQVALAVAQALASGVDRDQRRRAGGVDRHARALQTERERDAAGGGVQSGARGEVDVAARRVVDVEALCVIDRGDADEHAGPAAVESVGRYRGVFEGFPGHFEQQALLRVESDRLARRHAEEGRLETENVIEETARLGARLAGCAGVWIEVRVDVPALGRHLADHVASFGEQFPVAARIDHAAREAAAQADDRDRLVLGRLGRVQACLQALDRFERVLQHLAAVCGRRVHAAAAVLMIGRFLHGWHAAPWPSDSM